MDTAQTVCNLEQKTLGFRSRYLFVPLQLGAERFAVDEFHDNIRRAGLTDNAVDADNGRIVEMSESPGLVQEALKTGIECSCMRWINGGDIAGRKPCRVRARKILLDRKRLAQGRVARKISDPKSARAQGLFNDIGLYLVARFQTRLHRHPFCTTKPVHIPSWR